MPPRKRALHSVKPDRTKTPRATIAQTQIKGDKLFQLVASGLTLTEAGRQLEMTEPQASKLFNEALARQAESQLSLRQNMLERELETLRLLKRAHMPRALSGDVQSARVVLGVVDRVADLAGLSQQVKVTISNQRVDDTVTGLLEMLESKDDQIPQLLESGVLNHGMVIEGETEDGEANAG